MRNTTEPSIPPSSDADSELDDLAPGHEAVIRERLTVYTEEKAAARPWPEVKARLLQHYKA